MLRERVFILFLSLTMLVGARTSITWQSHDPEKTGASWYRKALIRVEQVLNGPQRERYRIAAARDIDDRPKDAVLPLKSAHVDLASATGLPSSNYRVQWSELDQKGPTEVRSVQFGAQTQQLFPTPHPGVYRLSMLNEDGERTGTDAWYLALPEREATSAGQQYARFNQQLSADTAGRSATDIESMRRAYLQLLFEDAVKTP